jgi:hypothetical protein
MIPAAVRDFVKSLPGLSALVGCRAGGQSFPCCEYDIAVFGHGTNSVVQVGDHSVELVYIQDGVIEFGDIEIIKDSKSFSLSSRIKEAMPEKRAKALRASGRKVLVASLMYQQRMKDARNPILASMWLKAGAYQFIGGALALAGKRPMPAHELGQARQAELGAMSEGIQAALECIGIERATRPAIARSVEAIKELKAGDYDAGLLRSKAEWMLEKSMIADCYYFLGRAACQSLASRNNAFHAKYAKLAQLALDLSVDQQGLEKLQKSLSRAVKKALS